MKKLVAIALAFGVVGSAALLAPRPAEATMATLQGSQDKTNVGQLLSGLINVSVNVLADDVVTVNDINIEDIEIVDVTDSLNGLKVQVLNNAINHNKIASDNQDVLNNLLRDAEIIEDTSVVVGVLGGAIYVLPEFP